jgi:hypothetical protein
VRSSYLIVHIGSLGEGHLQGCLRGLGAVFEVAKSPGLSSHLIWPLRVDETHWSSRPHNKLTSYKCMKPLMIRRLLRLLLCCLSWFSCGHESSVKPVMLNPLLVHNSLFKSFYDGKFLDSKFLF